MQKARGLTLSLGEGDDDKKEEADKTEEEADKKEEEADKKPEGEKEDDINDRAETSPEKK